MTKIGIVITPYISNDLHLRYTIGTLNSIKTKHKAMIIAHVNHWRVGGQEKKILEEMTDILRETGRNNVSMAWNKGIRKAFSEACTYALVPNLDIIFNQDCIDNLVQFAREHPDAYMWTASEWPQKKTIQEATWDNSFDEHPHFSCFMVDKRLFEEIGPFDEQFEPAYNEDNDMHYRIKLRGKIALKTASAKFYHYGSRTIKSDLELEQANIYTHGLNNMRYKAKWGGMPHQEVFKTPYNK